MRTLAASVVCLLGMLVGTRDSFAQDAVSESAGEIASGSILDARDFSCALEKDPSQIVISTSASRSLDVAQHFILEEPYRFVVDLPGFLAGRPQVIAVAGSDLAHRLRVAQRGAFSRLVVDLKGPVSVSRFLSSDGKRLSFQVTPAVGVAVGEETDKTDVKRVEQAINKPTGAVAAAVASQGESIAAVSPQPPTPELPEETTLTADRSDSRNKPARTMDVSVPKSAISPESVLKFSVSDTFLSFESGERPIIDVDVVNKVNEDLFLRADLQEVIDAGAPDESYRPTGDVLASPRRFVLPPLGSRAIRLIMKGALPPEGERVFRLILSPEETDLSKIEVDGLINEVPSKVRVVAALGVTVSMPSANSTGLVRIENERGGVQLRNTGDRIVVVTGCSSCPLNKDACVASPRKLLYPNQPWSLPVTGSGVIHCDLKIGKEVQKLSSFYGRKGDS